MVARSLLLRGSTLLVCLVLLAAGSIESPAQTSQAPASVKPRLDDNQRLLQELDSEFDTGNDLIAQKIASLESEVTLKAVSKVPPKGSDARELMNVGTAFKSGKDAVDAYFNEEYLDALSSVIKLGVKFLPEAASGPAGWAALGTDVVIKGAEVGLMARDQARLAEAEWKLRQATEYARFKDPQTQADLKRLYKQIYADTDAWDRKFKTWIAQNGPMLEALQKALADESNRQAAEKALKGLAIVDPDDGVQALKKQPCINPDFTAALEKQNQALEMGNTTAAGGANKNPGGDYIPAFRSDCKPAQGNDSASGKRQGAVPESMLDPNNQKVSDKASPSRNLDGLWTGYYETNQREPMSEVRITQTGSNLTAVKTIGNQFVPAGEISWTASVAGNQGRGTAHLAWIRGGMRDPYTVSVSVTIQNEDTIVLTGPSLNWIFRRK